MYYIQNELIYR